MNGSASGQPAAKDAMNGAGAGGGAVEGASEVGMSGPREASWPLSQASHALEQDRQVKGWCVRVSFMCPGS